MLKSNLLDIALGLIVVYLSLSLIATAVNEWVMRLVYSRGYNLKKAVLTMLHDENGETQAGLDFFKHPLFVKTHEETGRLPSYVSPLNFSHILTDIIAGYKEGKPHTIDNIRAGLELQKAGETRDLLMSFLSNSQNVDEWRIHIETWFVSTMERASGWYKRKVQISLLQVGFCLAALMNVDTFSLISHLKMDTQSVEALAQLAQGFKDIPASEQANVSNAFQIFNNPGLYGLGWHPPQELYIPSKFIWILSQFFQHLPGWILSAIAVSLGAPFWFDLLTKLTKLKSPESSTSNKSKPVHQTKEG